jgi:hypothetical protein
MKTEINLVASAMKQAGVDIEKIRNVIDLLNAEAQKDDAEEKAPPVKKQNVVILSDPANALKGCDFAAWIVQIPEQDSPATVSSRINACATDYNLTQKGRALPVKTVGESLESIPAKMTKEHELWVKTRTPCSIVRTDNTIAKQTIE